jgi:hypothetical protein
VTTSTSRIEDRIRKLLRLGQSPFEAEAQRAIEMAFELAARHQIEIEAMDLDERERRIVSVAVECGLRLPLEKALALNVLCRFFNVSTVRCGRNVRFCGRADDVEIARYVFEFLSSTVRGLVNERRSERRHGHRFTENRRRNFIFGFYYGVTARLNARKAELIPEGSSTALALVDHAEERSEFIAETIGATRSLAIARPKRKDPDAMVAGFLHGKQTEIRPAVSGSSSRSLRLGVSPPEPAP